MGCKKIHILTFHCAYSVGAMLQAYALSHVLQQMGSDVEVIDYRPDLVRNRLIDQYASPHLWNRMKIRFLDWGKLAYRLVWYYPHRALRYRAVKGCTSSAFAEFMLRFLPLSEKTFYREEELQEYADKSDIFITGSDQVWNPALSATPGAYLLDFVKSGIKTSYGASFGSCKLNQSYADKLAKALPGFRKISVREENARILLQETLGLPAVQVVDPVFLLPREQWLPFIHPVQGFENCIFVYRTERNSALNRDVDGFRNADPKLKVVIFDGIQDGLLADIKIAIKGPAEFLSYLSACKFVCTNSFHGAAFSLIFQKKARIYSHSAYNDRILSLMDLAGSRENDGRFELSGNEYPNLSAARSASLDFLQSICRL